MNVLWHELIHCIAVSHAFGYGMMDAGAMTELARRWKNVPPQHTCEIHGPITKRFVRIPTNQISDRRGF